MKMIRVQRPVLLVVAVIIMVGPRLEAFPEPSLIPVAWQLAFTHDMPRTISVRGVDGRTHWYWYLPYKVVNQSETEQMFVPEFTVATDKGDIITTNRHIPPNVYTAITRRLANPLLENPLQVSGRLLIGEDQAKESVAIWPVFEHDVDRQRVFVAGLSGETQVVTHPLTGKDVALRKTLMLTYRTPGTPLAYAARQKQTIELKNATWVMR